MRKKFLLLFLSILTVEFPGWGEETVSPPSLNSIEFLLGYSAASKYDSVYQGAIVTQNSTDAANITLRYLRTLNLFLDIGLEASLESNRSFIGRTTGGVVFAYLNPVPNLTVAFSELMARINYKSVYVNLAGGYNFPFGVNFPAGFNSSWIFDGGLGWHASDSFILELSYRNLNLLSGYYESFKQSGFLVRVGYSFR